MKNNHELTPLNELSFEAKDLEIFKIPDNRTRLDTLQNYFFPRLEFLMVHTVDLIKTVFEVNPYEQMTVVFSPKHRKKAQVNRDIRHVLVGLSGKREKNKLLNVRRRNGKPYSLHRSQLAYFIDQKGLEVNLCFFNNTDLDQRFLASVSELIQENFALLHSVLSLNHIICSTWNSFDIRDTFKIENLELEPVWLLSPTYYLPIDFNRGLLNIIFSFITLYPLLESLTLIEKGHPPKLSESLDKLVDWLISGGWKDYTDSVQSQLEENGKNNVLIDLPELNSYSLIRAGLWWDILARDNWTCCSCKRSAQKHGVTLHIDHIKPRSKGGTNDKSNLQTLCMKCNIGKSNKDSTDLRE